tara:strand:+ start:589 stop:975 length:387 start_codon:yes stop_codon:yes gene_type:complete
MRTWRDQVMMWKWRFEQFQSILGPAFYITTLTLLVYPYLSWRLDGLFYGLVLTWIAILIVVMIAARLWDAFGLWREGQRANVRRNQFSQGALSPKEVMMMEKIWIPLLEKEKVDTTAIKDWIKEKSEK